MFGSCSIDFSHVTCKWFEGAGAHRSCVCVHKPAMLTSLSTYMADFE